MGQKLAYVLVHDDKAHSSGMSGLEVEDAVRLFLNERCNVQIHWFLVACELTLTPRV